MKNILVLDDAQTPTIVNRLNYSDYVGDEEAKLLVFTSTNALSEVDKTSSRVIAWKEVDGPTSDGTLELWSLEMHKKHTITDVYTKNEDLIIRAAYIRKLLGIKTGLQADDVWFFREKVLMKERCKEKGFPVPPFKRVLSPSCILDFVIAHGYPVIIKPTLGSATVGLNVLRNETDLEHYFKTELFGGMDFGKRMDFAGELIIEKFIEGTMFHVNGYAKNGKIEIIWPFEYIKTCLSFREGQAYGNSFIAEGDPNYTRLREATAKLLTILPQPDNLTFHLELFENSQAKGKDDEFILCEIAARRPGGSISALINILEDNKFNELDFRANVGLPVRHNRKLSEGTVVTDLLVPLKPGTLSYTPASCEIEGLKYIPIAKQGTVYKGFDVNVLNSACRFVAIGPNKKETIDLVEKGQEWFEKTSITTPLSTATSLRQTPQ